MNDSRQTEPDILLDIQAILFDLDGTLVDTDDMVVERLAKRLQPILRIRARRVARWLMMKAETPGNAFLTTADIFGLDGPLMSFADRLRGLRGLKPASDFRLLPGVELMLEKLSACYRLGLVTTRSWYHIDQLFMRYPVLQGRFDATVALQDSRRLKPHPGPLKAAVRQLDVAFDRCLMVGDTVVDIKAGRRAGIRTCGVLCGFGEREELERAGADFILETTADLFHLLVQDE